MSRNNDRKLPSPVEENRLINSGNTEGPNEDTPIIKMSKVKDKENIKSIRGEIVSDLHQSPH